MNFMISSENRLTNFLLSVIALWTTPLIAATMCQIGESFLLHLADPSLINP